MSETFKRLKKESEEIQFDGGDKTMVVLNKNLELALNEKSFAVLRLGELQRALDEDYTFLKRVKLNKKNQLKKVQRIYSGSKIIENHREDDEEFKSTISKRLIYK